MKAIGYIRVSTEEQAREGISLAHQEAKVRAYAALHDLDLVEIVRDEGVSAKSIAGRPGAQRVVDLAKAGKVDAVVIYKLDRLFRNATEALMTSSCLSKKGVGLHSVTESIDTLSAMGRFFFTIMAALAEMERNLISERTADALRHKKANGEVYNHPPYGWNREGDLLRINDEEQEVITWMQQKRAEGWGYQGIADRLNLDEVPSKTGGKWHPQTVKNIIVRATAEQEGR